MKLPTHVDRKWPELIIAVFYGAALAVILGLILFVSGNISYACKNVLPRENLTYLLWGILVWVGSALTVQAVRRWLPAVRLPLSGNQLIAILSLLLAGVQFYSVYQYYFYTGWDVGGAVLPMVEYLTSGTPEQLDSYDFHWLEYYFSVYPNNQLLMFILCAIRRFTLKVGITAVSATLPYYLAMNCILCALSGWLLFQVLNQLTGRQATAWWGWLLFVGLVAASPWCSIPYSDAVGVIFPILTAWLYLRYLSTGKNRFLFLLTLSGYIALKIKPQASFFLIAALLMELVEAGRKLVKRSFHISSAVKKIGCMLLGFVLAIVLCTAASNSLNINLDSDHEFGWQHFLMMGMNEENGGVYSGEDVAFSGSIYPRQLRNAEDLKLAGTRIRDMGLFGFCRFLVKKALTVFADGTFAWTQEGTFFREIYPEKNGFLSPFFRSLFYENGARWDSWAGFSQTLWLLCLSGMVFAARTHFDEDYKQTFLAALMLGVLGLIAFELLFEARARYLFVFCPIFVALAAMGGQTVWDAMTRFLEKKPLRMLPGRRA